MSGRAEQPGRERGPPDNQSERYSNEPPWIDPAHQKVGARRTDVDRMRARCVTEPSTRRASELRAHETRADDHQRNPKPDRDHDFLSRLHPTERLHTRMMSAPHRRVLNTRAIATRRRCGGSGDTDGSASLPGTSLAVAVGVPRTLLCNAYVEDPSAGRTSGRGALEHADQYCDANSDGRADRGPGRRQLATRDDAANHCGDDGPTLSTHRRPAPPKVWPRGEPQLVTDQRRRSHSHKLRRTTLCHLRSPSLRDARPFNGAAI